MDARMPLPTVSSDKFCSIDADKNVLQHCASPQRKCGTPLARRTSSGADFSVLNADKNFFQRNVSPDVEGETSFDRRTSNSPEYSLIKSDNFVHMTAEYNDNSQVQQQGSELMCRWLPQLVKNVVKMLPEGSPLRVVEFGCATGGSSLAPLKVVEHAAAGVAEVIVTMNDLPLNSWDVLKATVEPEFKKFAFNYSPCSMYEKCVVTEGTHHLGYSCYAQHWLNDGCPCPLPGGAMWANQVLADHPARASWAWASKMDWLRFLQLRAREIVKGGYLLLHIQAATLDGSLNEHCASIMAKAKAELLAEGTLTEREASRMNLPEYLKSPFEVLEPLRDSNVSHSWKLMDFYYTIPGCPYETKMMEEHLPESDAIKDAISTLQAFCNPSLLSEVGAEKVDLFWKRVSELCVDIDAVSANVASIVLVLRRV